MSSAPEVVLPKGEPWRPPGGAPSRPGDAVRLGAAAALHLLVLGAVLVITAAPPLNPAEEAALETEVIDARAFDAAYPPAPAPQASAPAPAASAPPAPALPGAAAPSAGAPVAAPAAAPPDETVRPTRMLSAQALASPKSRALRRELATLADEERIAQLCDLEAMEQIHAWRASFQPDRLVDYARAEPRLEGARFVAEGGAFRSRRGWYEVAFHCELDAGRQVVVGFAFRVGAAIPPDQWAGDNLAAVH